MFHMNLQISDAHESPFRISMENVDLFKISSWQKLSSIIGDSGTKHLINVQMLGPGDSGLPGIGIYLCTAHQIAIIS
jgi:hypothetical protein